MRGIARLRAMARTAVLLASLALLALAAGRYLLRAPLLVEWHREVAARIELPVSLEIRIRLRFEAP